MAHLLLLLLLLLLVVMMVQCLLKASLLLGLLLLNPFIGHHEEGHIEGAFKSGLSTRWRCGCLIVVIVISGLILLR